MLDLAEAVDLKVGAELRGRSRLLTQVRADWCSGGMRSAGAGERVELPKNIHTDVDYAKAQGLPTTIADGMHSANWLSTMLTDYFGAHYISHGELRTKFIRPVLVNVATVTPRGTVRSREDMGPQGVRYELEVWCEDADGTKLVVGDAVIRVVSDPVAL